MNYPPGINLQETSEYEVYRTPHPSCVSCRILHRAFSLDHYRKRLIGAGFSWNLLRDGLDKMNPISEWRAGFVHSMLYMEEDCAGQCDDSRFDAVLFNNWVSASSPKVP